MGDRGRGPFSVARCPNEIGQDAELPADLPKSENGQRSTVNKPPMRLDTHGLAAIEPPTYPPLPRPYIDHVIRPSSGQGTAMQRVNRQMSRTAKADR